MILFNAFWVGAAMYDLSAVLRVEAPPFMAAALMALLALTPRPPPPPPPPPAARLVGDNERRGLPFVGVCG